MLFVARVQPHTRNAVVVSEFNAAVFKGCLNCCQIPKVFRGYLPFALDPFDRESSNSRLRCQRARCPADESASGPHL